MQIQQQIVNKNNVLQHNSLLLCLCLLTAFFIAAQIAVIIAYSTVPYAVSVMWANKSIVIPRSVWWNCCIFCAIQLMLYIILTLIIWLITKFSGQLLKFTESQTFKLGIWLCGLSFIAILSANSIYFPTSIFARSINIILPTIVIKIILFTTSLILVCFSIVAGMRLLQLTYLRAKRLNQLIKLAIAALIIILVILYINNKHMPSITTTKSTKPNVIVIGIDALRPDYVKFYNHKTNNMPKLSSFLAQATVFMSSMTPQAQTSPAWESILTGQYPKHDGIRFVFAPSKQLDTHNTLANILHAQHYTTIFSTDDWRFIAITKRFGFDYIIGANSKVNNFLLGTLNDFPLTNLLINTRLGAILFPYSYANRAAYWTYQPGTYLTLLKNRLRQIKNRPVFLCVHLCLSHWPYLWDDPLGATSASVNNLEYIYDAATKRADIQFANLIKLLQQENLLENAILVVMSDHGEALLLPGDRLISKEKYVAGKFSHANIMQTMIAAPNAANKLNTSHGHGNDVLSPSQLYNVLAFRFYGKQFTNTPRKIFTATSLIDIKPTILDILQIHHTAFNMDGKTLAPYITSTKLDSNQPRMLFTDSGFAPIATLDEQLSIAKVLIQSLNFFKINPATSDITINPNTAPKIILNTQKALYYGNWILAFYPTTKQKFITILANKKTGAWTDDLSTSFAQNAPLGKMLTAMQNFYGKELGTRGRN